MQVSELGQPLTIFCGIVSSNPNYTVSWFGPSGYIEKSNKNYTYIRDKAGVRLHSPITTVDHDGTYLCILKVVAKDVFLYDHDGSIYPEVVIGKKTAHIILITVGKLRA